MDCCYICAAAGWSWASKEKAAINACREAETRRQPRQLEKELAASHPAAVAQTSTAEYHTARRYGSAWRRMHARARRAGDGSLGVLLLQVWKEKLEACCDL